jgi:hypothetical protein
MSSPVDRVSVDEDWLTPPKAAELLHLKPKTLQECRASGTGPNFFKASLAAMRGCFTSAAT